MKKIKLSPSKYGQFYALVDNEDYNKLMKYKWHLHKNHDRGFYISRCFNDPQDWHKVKNVSMHREIMGFPNSHIDHVNRNSFDNRKRNLRLCSCGQNRVNSKLNKNNHSGHRNIYWTQQTGRWRAVLNSNRQKIHLGYFLNFSDAVQAVERKSKEIHGDFFNA